ncbi:hypothetical protein [Stakelama saccharophila]|uniref:Uncharacterized protein n=1 Tax=Stakelama saccharophila TaxID=3075605 RepID=A0ABZ0B5R9_9SPHN|nr:hypothetical protein [Stakelama sp. W311]WNO52724.1 hypothetical protein RPR59_09630 [Stakelama sp. W311]
MTRNERRYLLTGPIATWLGMLLLGAISAGYTQIPGTPIRLVVQLVLLSVQLALITLFFMQLRRAEGLVRLAAMAGAIWASFLFLFAFSDYLTR